MDKGVHGPQIDELTTLLHDLRMATGVRRSRHWGTPEHDEARALEERLMQQILGALRGVDEPRRPIRKRKLPVVTAGWAPTLAHVLVAVLRGHQ